MAYVVTEKCIGCRHGSCVEICPADAFHAGPNMLVINPTTCIDCGNCVPACPETAIIPPSAVTTPHNQKLAKLNTMLAKRWPMVDTNPGGPLPGHETARMVTDREARTQLLKVQ